MIKRFAFFAVLGLSLTGLYLTEGSKLRATEASAAEKAAASPAPSASPSASASPAAQVKVITKEECITHEAAVEDIRKRRDELELKVKELAARETELLAKEKALEEQLKKIQSVRDEIARIEGVAKQQNEVKMTRLVETIEAMNPKSAAKMIATLDEGLAVAAIERLSATKVGKIMNLLEPETSSRLNEVMAGVVRAKGLKASRNSSSYGGAATAQFGKGGEKNERNDDNTSASQSGSGRTPASQPGSARP